MSFDPFDDCLYIETMKELKTALTEAMDEDVDGLQPTSWSNQELHPDDMPNNDLAGSNELHPDDFAVGQEAAEIEGVDPFVEKLNQVLSIMDELKDMSIGNSAGWTDRHTEAFQKYLKGFTHYCNELKDDLTNYDKPV